MKIVKEKKVGACSLVRNTFGVRKACWNFGMRTTISDKHVNYSYQFTQTKQQVG
jgi:hypothetical protein